MSREAVQFQTWTEFLLEVYSVETLDPNSNPLRSGPGEEFPQTGSTESLELRVLAIQGSWAKVEGVDANEASLPTGWIRWRDDGQLLIDYSLLS